MQVKGSRQNSSFEFRRLFFRRASILLASLAALFASPILYAQTQSCGGQGQTQCPAPPPLQCTIPGVGPDICQAIKEGPWMYTNGALPFNAPLSGWFNSL